VTSVLHGRLNDSKVRVCREHEALICVRCVCPHPIPQFTLGDCIVSVLEHFALMCSVVKRAEVRHFEYCHLLSIESIRFLSQDLRQEVVKDVGDHHRRHTEYRRTRVADYTRTRVRIGDVLEEQMARRGQGDDGGGQKECNVQARRRCHPAHCGEGRLERRNHT